MLEGSQPLLTTVPVDPMSSDLQGHPLDTQIKTRQTEGRTMVPVFYTGDKIKVANHHQVLGCWSLSEHITSLALESGGLKLPFTGREMNSKNVTGP